MRWPTALVATVVALASWACSDGGTTVGAGDGTTTTTATSTPRTTVAPGVPGLVLQIATGGGFVPVELSFGAVPEFTLYADGRVVVTGPTTAEYPGHALANLLAGSIGDEGVRAAVAAAREAGVAAAPDLGRPLVADAPTTTFVVVEGGRTHRVDAYALGLEAGGLSAAQRDARRRLEDLSRRMHDVGAAADLPYRATAVSVLVAPAPDPAAVPSPDPPPGEADWPLADLGTGGTEQPGGRCLPFTGQDAERVLAAAAQARSNTRWRSGGRLWVLSFRPELPGVVPCGPR